MRKRQGKRKTRSWTIQLQAKYEGAKMLEENPFNLWTFKKSVEES